MKLQEPSVDAAQLTVLQPIQSYHSSFNSQRYYQPNFRPDSHFINFNNLSQNKTKNNLILIETKEDDSKSLLNQCQEVSSTIFSSLNQGEKRDHFGQKPVFADPYLGHSSKCDFKKEADNKNKIDSIDVSLIKKEVQIEKYKVEQDAVKTCNEDDFVALKNKFRLQLEQQLFDKNDIKSQLKENEISLASKKGKIPIKCLHRTLLSQIQVRLKMVLK